jgi:hypothetical protein
MEGCGQEQVVLRTELAAWVEPGGRELCSYSWELDEGPQGRKEQVRWDLSRWVFSSGRCWRSYRSVRGRPILRGWLEDVTPPQTLSCDKARPPTGDSEEPVPLHGTPTSPRCTGVSCTSSRGPPCSLPNSTFRVTIVLAANGPRWQCLHLRNGQRFLGEVSVYFYKPRLLLKMHPPPLRENTLPSAPSCQLSCSRRALALGVLAHGKGLLTLQWGLGPGKEILWTCPTNDSSFPGTLSPAPQTSSLYSSLTPISL